MENQDEPLESILVVMAGDDALTASVSMSATYHGAMFAVRGPDEAIVDHVDVRVRALCAAAHGRFEAARADQSLKAAGPEAPQASSLRRVLYDPWDDRHRDRCCAPGRRCRREALGLLARR